MLSMCILIRSFPLRHHISVFGSCCRASSPVFRLLYLTKHFSKVVRTPSAANTALKELHASLPFTSQESGRREFASPWCSFRSFTFDMQNTFGDGFADVKCPNRMRKGFRRRYVLVALYAFLCSGCLQDNSCLRPTRYRQKYTIAVEKLKEEQYLLDLEVDTEVLHSTGL